MFVGSGVFIKVFSTGCSFKQSGLCTVSTIVNYRIRQMNGGYQIRTDDVGTKIPCLTAWLNPNVRVRSPSAHTLYNNYEGGGVSVPHVETLYRAACYGMRRSQHIAFPSRFRLGPCGKDAVVSGCTPCTLRRLGLC